LPKLLNFVSLTHPRSARRFADAAIGAADTVIVPAEASVKGYGSLVRTLDLLNSMRDVKATNATVLGVLPWSDRWIGNTQTLESCLAVEGMKDKVKNELILPSMRESEQYKKAINKHQSLRELGHPDLEYPWEILLAKSEFFFKTKSTMSDSILDKIGSNRKRTVVRNLGVKIRVKPLWAKD
jgi:chromosome partitioning protein